MHRWVTFSVNTRALAGLPLALDRRAGNLSACRDYLLANTKIGSFGLADILGSHERVITAIGDFLVALDFDYADAYSGRIRLVIASYRASDQRAAARADAIVPGVAPGYQSDPAITKAEKTLGPEVFADRYDPTAAFTTPGSHVADAPYQPNWSDLLSPGSLGRDAIWEITSFLADVGILEHPIDPFAVIVRPFVGDWAGLLRCADVFQQVAMMLRLNADCTTDESMLIPDVWTGNVAGIGQAVIERFTQIMQTGAQRCDALADAYRRIAKSVQDNANLMEMLVTDLIDLGSDAALDVVTLGFFELFAAGGQVRDFVNTMRGVLRIIDDVTSLKDTAKSAADDAANGFGILLKPAPLTAAGPIPTQIPIPTAPPPPPRHAGKPTSIPWDIWLGGS